AADGRRIAINRQLGEVALHGQGAVHQGGNVGIRDIAKNRQWRSHDRPMDGCVIANEEVRQVAAYEEVIGAAVVVGDIDGGRVARDGDLATNHGAVNLQQIQHGGGQA